MLEKSTTTVAEAYGANSSSALNAGAVARSTSPTTSKTYTAVQGWKGCPVEMLIGCRLPAHRGFDGYRVRGNAATERSIPTGSDSYPGPYGDATQVAMGCIG
jgi:hypothetical protein